MKQETCTPKKQCLGLRTLTIFWVANSNIAKNARCGTSLEHSHSSTRQRARREPGHGLVWTSADPTGVVTAVSRQRAPGAWRLLHGIVVTIPRARGGPPLRYSTLILAVRITLLHFSASAAMNLAKSAGEPASGAAPKSASRAFMSGSARAAFTSLFSVSMISGGVFFGAATPNQLLASKPGRNSLTVGTCGRISQRSALVTANARSLPALTCSIDDGASANITCT